MAPTLYEWDITQNRFVESKDASEPYDELCQRLNCNNCLIGLCFRKSAKLALLMNSVRNSGNAFAWLDPSADIQFIKNRCLRMRVNVILSEENLSWPSNSSYNYDETTKIWVSFLPYSDSLNIFGPNFVYAICTSGSTGDPKVVHVTESAIMPNIHDFVNRFQLNNISKLLWSTSLDFDPSLVELLLAFETNCSLFIINDFDVKCIWRFVSAISTVCPTLLQITPAVLNLFSTNFLLELLGPKSPIEHLLIGGDTFPTELVLRYANNCSAKIYNVYGVTEVSCWASCTQFRPFSDVVADASNAISDTRLIFAPDGVEIYGRTCVVNGERKSGVQTGDQFICVTSNEKKAYVITSREKINGIVVAREVENFILANFGFIEMARLVTFKDQLFVFVKRMDDSNEEVAIPDKFNIKSIFYIDEFPITTNGKIDDIKLRSLIQHNESIRTFQGTVFDYMRRNPSLQCSNESIASLGFSSRDLFEFIFELTQNIDISMDLEDVKRKLFDSQTPIAFLFELISSCQTKLSLNCSDKDVITLQNASKMEKYQVRLVDKIAMKKCVDFTPTFYNNMIFVGDMSGYFAIFNTNTKNIIVEHQHEEAVITQCLIHSETAVYCTINGQVHCIDLATFQLTSLSVGDSIRSEPSIFDETRIFVATFSQHLVLLNLSNSEYEKVCDLSSGCIRNSPVTNNEFVVVSDIDGNIGGFRKRSLKWRRRLKKSIFVPLFLFPSEDTFGVLCLDGSLHFMTMSDGTITNTVNFNASCSVPPTISSDLILIPCGKDLIKLMNSSEIEYKEKTYKLPNFSHKSRLVYSILLGKYLIKCNAIDESSCTILAINFENQTHELLLQMDAPSFGDLLIVPTTNQTEHLIIGARDNFIHLFELIKAG